MDYNGTPPPQGHEEQRHEFRRDDDVVAHHIYKHIYPLQERLVKVETALEYQKNNLDEVKSQIINLDHKLTKRIDDTSQQLLHAIETSRAEGKKQLEDHAHDELKKYEQIRGLSQLMSEQISQAKYGILGVGGTVAILWTIVELGVKLNWFH